MVLAIDAFRGSSSAGDAGAPTAVSFSRSRRVFMRIPNFYSGQIKDIYDEITQGKPRGEITQRPLRKPSARGRCQERRCQERAVANRPNNTGKKTAVAKTKTTARATIVRLVSDGVS